MSRKFSLLAASIVCSACTSAAVHSSRDPANQAASPRLFMQASPVFDTECSQKSGFKVDPAWYPELFERLPEFQKAWDDRAAALIRASEEIVGQKFSRTEYTVGITLCKWTPMAYPFIMSLRPFLKAPAAADPKIKNPLSMPMFVDLTHHELLHNLTDAIVLNPNFRSPLLVRYQTESPNVLVHLHLMAVQKAANTKLADTELLKNADALYAYIGGDYARAWQIIATEGAEAFVKELRSSP